MITMSTQESDKEEPLPEKRHSRSEKKLDLAPFTELLEKYNFTAFESYNFSDCHGQYADLMEDLIEKEGTPWMEDLQRGRQKHCKRILLVVDFNRPYYSSIKFLRRIYAPIFHNKICLSPTKTTRVTQGFSGQILDSKKSLDFTNTWLCQRS